MQLIKYFVENHLMLESLTGKKIIGLEVNFFYVHLTINLLLSC